MKPVSPINNISKLLRKTLSENKKTEKSKSAITSDNASIANKQAKKSLAQTKQKIALKILELPANDRLGDKGISILITNMLDWELNRDVIQDDAFKQALDKIQKSINENKNTQAEAKQIISNLISEYG